MALDFRDLWPIPLSQLAIDVRLVDDDLLLRLSHEGLTKRIRAQTGATRLWLILLWPDPGSIGASLLDELRHETKTALAGFHARRGPRSLDRDGWRSGRQTHESPVLHSMAAQHSIIAVPIGIDEDVRDIIWTA